jgi:hypothetical protein
MFSFFEGIPKPIILFLLVLICVIATTDEKESVKDSQYVTESSHPIWDKQVWTSELHLHKDTTKVFPYYE